VVRDYLYVSDAVDALITAARTHTRTKIFNVGSGEGVSLNELIELMARVVGERPQVEYRARRPLDVPVSVLAVDRAREGLGWRPRTDLAEGIARTWDWICSLSHSRVGH
jgi:UDP-glucose 4-epimerase